MRLQVGAGWQGKGKIAAAVGRLRRALGGLLGDPNRPICIFARGNSLADLLKLATPEDRRIVLSAKGIVGQVSRTRECCLEVVTSPDIGSTLPQPQSFLRLASRAPPSASCTRVMLL